ncbi:MAG: hypothetical protein ABJH98_10930 [Reichenbachiella sp.]|uniref:hypothetical protein n=1 Tax=Reichenbachiella sp. TaxID=2184521 RepID=UPI0032999FD6
MKLIYDNYLNEIHSFDSYYGEIVIESDSLTIPYINLGVSEHPLNEGKDLKFINKAYMVFEDVVSFDEQFSLDEYKGTLTLYFGGYNLKEREHKEFKVVCNRAYLNLLEESEMSHKMWVPINTPNLKSNMDKEDVQNFLLSRN